MTGKDLDGVDTSEIDAEANAVPLETLQLRNKVRELEREVERLSERDWLTTRWGL